MKRSIFLLLTLGVSFLSQKYLGICIEKEFISALLTVFAIFYGFYVTSYAVFATSKYLSKLYQIENPTDNRKTLLDDLLEEFTSATYILLGSLIYLVIAYVILENRYPLPFSYFLYFIWAVILINFFYAFRTINTFIKITRQSAKENSK